MRTALLVTALYALLSGCGQKGPLFIPNDSTAPAPTSAAQLQTEANPL